MRKVFIAIAAAALLSPATALAGGWATVGVTLPDEIGPGQTWNAELKVLQHGRTPLIGVEPLVTISKGKKEQAFPARATDEPGVYVAEVVFPSAGKWSYRVDDGFGRTHTFAPIAVQGEGGAAGAVGDGGGVPLFALLLIGTVAIVTLAVLYLLARRVRVRAPAPTP